MGAGKLSSIDQLRKIVEAAKKGGKKVVWANGCFDLLHVGHIRYLKAAKDLGDLLIVGINGDATVEKLKGHGRPLMSEADRAEIIANLECVDYVTIFHEPTVDRVLTLVKPHVHAKGTDYTMETVPEKNTMLTLGGSIAIVGDKKDHATKDLIARIAERYRTV